MTSFFEDFSGAALEYNFDSSLISIQGPIRKITGYSKKELLEGEINWHSVVHPADRDQLVAEFKAQLEDNVGYSGVRDYRILTKKKETKWIGEQFRILGKKEDASVVVKAVICDITKDKEQEIVRKHEREALYDSLGLKIEPFEASDDFLQKQILGRKVAEAELLKKRDFLEHVLDSFAYPFFVIDANTYEVTLANKAAKGLFPERGNTCYQISHNRDTPCDDTCVCPLQTVRKTKKPYSTEHIHYDKHDNERYFAVHAFPMLDSRGEVHQVIEYSYDITDQRHAESALKESEEKYRLLFNSERDAIMLVDVETLAILDINKGAEQLYQYTKEEFLSLKAPDISAEPDETTTKINQTKLNESVLIPLRWHKKKDGTEFPVEISAAVFDYNGALTLCSIIRDISERKEREEQQSRLIKRLHTSQKMNAIGTLAGGIAHDFNNILFAQIGYLEMALSKTPASNEIHHFLKESLDASQRASNLVSQILTFSRSDHVVTEPINIAPILKETVKMLQKGTGANIEINSDVDVRVSNVIGNPVQIQQIILNIASNAEEAMQKDGGILNFQLSEVKLKKEKAHAFGIEKAGSYIKMEISDTGVGMSAKVKEHIFEPYYTTKTYWEGSGMGLAVVHGIVTNSMNGVIRVESTVGKGTRFTMYFPALKEGEKKENFKIENLKKEKKLLKYQASVLMVDANDMSLSLGKEMMESIGYYVVGLSDPRKSIELLSAEPDAFDLAMVDSRILDMSGFQLSKKLQQINPELKIILMIKEGKQVEEKELKKSGIRHVLTKPFSKHKLLKITGKIIDQPEIYPFIG